MYCKMLEAGFDINFLFNILEFIQNLFQKKSIL